MAKINLNLCNYAVLKTLSYSGVFNFPLTINQIKYGLISKNSFSLKQIKKELNRLIGYGIVKKTKSRYILKGIKTRDVDKRKKNSQEIVEKNKPTLKAISKIPWIKMIAITGSVANQNAEKDDDIDLLFITQKNRLWISRGFVFLILKVLGKLPANQNIRKVCPNIFIDERNMGWAKKKRNLYIANNIISMQPYIWKEDTYFKFMKENKWVGKYFRNFKIEFPMHFAIKRIHESRTMRILESLAKKAQMDYMKNSLTTEIAKDTLIHFNKNDTSRKTLVEYKKLFQKTLKSLDN